MKKKTNVNINNYYLMGVPRGGVRWSSIWYSRDGNGIYHSSIGRQILWDSISTHSWFNCNSRTPSLSCRMLHFEMTLGHANVEVLVAKQTRCMWNFISTSTSWDDLVMSLASACSVANTMIIIPVMITSTPILSMDLPPPHHSIHEFWVYL